MSLLDKARILEQLAAELVVATTNSDMLNIKSNFLGKSSELTLASSKIKDYPIEDRKSIGSEINSVKSAIEDLINAKQIELENLIDDSNRLDSSLPAVGFELGASHPISRVIRQLEIIFGRAGFEVVAGNEIEDDYYNFTALNIPKNHPARDSHDTFYLENGLLLRTHTSNMQIRVLEKCKDFPLNLISTGKVYRKDYDNTHTPMFHQMEGLSIGKNINMRNLIHCLKGFLSEIFDSEVNLRIRPSYFPFTEPSIEVDIGCIFCSSGCSYCKGSKFIEILGAGMVHPNVLVNIGLDPNEYSGFAFGLGIERLASLLYKINDIRKFYEGNFDFIKQF